MREPPTAPPSPVPPRSAARARASRMADPAVLGTVEVRAACLAAEQRYGLRSTAPADCTAARRPTRAENEKAARRGLDEAPRITLRRQVTTAAASAGSEQEFFARLDQAGVLVRKRFSTRNPGQVTGYSVALPGDTAKDGGPVWYGGGKLAPDLSWPRLRHRRTRYRVTPGAGLTTGQRNAVWGTCRPRGRRRRRADPHPGRDRPGCRHRRCLGYLQHPPRGRRHTRQPHPAPGRRRLRPRRPLTLWPHPAAHPGREPAPPGRPAAVRVRLPDRRPLHGPDHAHHANWPRWPKPSPNSATPSSAPPRPPQPAPPPDDWYAAARPAPPAQPRPDQRASTAAQLAGLSFPHSARPATRPATPGQPSPAPGRPPPVRRPPPPRPRGPTR